MTQTTANHKNQKDQEDIENTIKECKFYAIGCYSTHDIINNKEVTIFNKKKDKDYFKTIRSFNDSDLSNNTMYNFQVINANYSDFAGVILMHKGEILYITLILYLI